MLWVLHQLWLLFWACFFSYPYSYGLFFQVLPVFVDYTKYVFCLIFFIFLCVFYNFSFWHIKNSVVLYGYVQENILSIQFFYMKTNTDIFSVNSAEILNLSGKPTESQLALAALSESVKIQVVNLTPESEVSQIIPVRFYDEPEDFSGALDLSEVTSMTKAIEALEDAIWEKTTDPVRYELLKLVYQIMES